jgi:hypothetical protein
MLASKPDRRKAKANRPLVRDAAGRLAPTDAGSAALRALLREL